MLSDLSASSSMLQRVFNRFSFTGNEVLDVLIVMLITKVFSLMTAHFQASAYFSSVTEWISEKVPFTKQRSLAKHRALVRKAYGKRVSEFRVCASYYPSGTLQQGSHANTQSIQIVDFDTRFYVSEATDIVNKSKTLDKTYFISMSNSTWLSEVALPCNLPFNGYDADTDIGVSGTFTYSSKLGSWDLDLMFWSCHRTAKNLTDFMGKRVKELVALERKTSYTPLLINTFPTKDASSCGKKSADTFNEDETFMYGLRLNVSKTVPESSEDLLLSQGARETIDMIINNVQNGEAQTLLMYGVPGSGKTTCIQYLAKKLGRDVLTPAYRDVDSFSKLVNIFFDYKVVNKSANNFVSHRKTNNKIVCFEEFDKDWSSLLQKDTSTSTITYDADSSSSSEDEEGETTGTDGDGEEQTTDQKKSKKRQKKKQKKVREWSFKPSLKHWLTLLGGYYDRSGQLIVLTCNELPDNIDPAAVRHGRIDKIIAFGYLQTTMLPKAIVSAANNTLFDKLSDHQKEELLAKAANHVANLGITSKQLEKANVTISRVNEVVSCYTSYTSISDNLEQIIRVIANISTDDNTTDTSSTDNTKDCAYFANRTVISS